MKKNNQHKTKKCSSWIWWFQNYTYYGTKLRASFFIFEQKKLKIRGSLIFHSLSKNNVPKDHKGVMSKVFCLQRRHVSLTLKSVCSKAYKWNLEIATQNLTNLKFRLLGVHFSSKVYMQFMETLFSKPNINNFDHYFFSCYNFQLLSWSQSVNIKILTALIFEWNYLKNHITYLLICCFTLL